MTKNKFVKKIKFFIVFLCLFSILSACAIPAFADTDMLSPEDGMISDGTDKQPFDPDAGTVGGSDTGGILDGVSNAIDGVSEAVSDIVSDVMGVGTDTAALTSSSASSEASGTSVAAAIIICLVIAVAVIVLVIVLIPKKKNCASAVACATAVFL